jgi:RNA polymerase sigma-70 factor (ECF subfamily)
MPNWLRSRSKPRDPPSGPKAPPEQIELRLLQGVRRGALADFEALYRIYHGRLQRFLLHLMRHGEQVDEVLNDTMMVVWQRADAFDGRSKLSTWIFGIAYRKALKALSRLDLPLDGEDADEAADPGPGPEQQLGLGQLRLRLQGALGELSVDHRAVVELCYFQDMAYDEIAQVVGCPPETVKTRMFYARRRLRVLLTDLAGLPDLPKAADGERS